MDYAHVFRRDKLNHVVLSKSERIRRDGTHVTVCALMVDRTFQRRVPGESVTLNVDCPPCLDFMTRLHDILEAQR